ncbi:homoserine dehydrogenase [Helicobacter baculiformis]|uniref:Homoserine dehydrogenase n=1 Tax=Helicobacter baculiformis TaxID=427351 RepID=A0ABV7ZG20_9HELI|nr:homoserine dehydrogenase [Helicobacter baculiformis]
MRTLNIGIIGLGCVGMGVVEILERNQTWIAQRCGCLLQIRKGVVRDLSKKRTLSFALSDCVEDILKDPKIDIVVELMGGVQDAFSVAQRALQNNKAFVTANKAMLAEYYHPLQRLAKKAIGFEASVGGGLPIVNALKEGLGANQILFLAGILNGTSNFILDQMELGAHFTQALQQAQALGYAEADPSLDLSGEDSAHKLSILATLAFHTQPTLNYLEGIECIESIDLQHARHLGYRIKLLASAWRCGQSLALVVRPTLIPQAHFLAQVDGVMNGMVIIGDCVGETFFYGAGAGGLASASAVVSDLMAVAKNPNPAPPLETLTYNYTDMPHAYYLRLDPLDLTSIVSILNTHAIQLDSYQVEHNQVICITKPTTQDRVQKVLHHFQQNHQNARALAIYESP